MQDDRRRPTDGERDRRTPSLLLDLGHSLELIVAALANAPLREEAGFYPDQVFEARVQQFHEWAEREPRRHILIAMHATLRPLAHRARLAADRWSRDSFVTGQPASRKILIPWSRSKAGAPTGLAKDPCFQQSLPPRRQQFRLISYPKQSRRPSFRTFGVRCADEYDDGSAREVEWRTINPELKAPI
jgi:hypothetical protein